MNAPLVKSNVNATASGKNPVSSLMHFDQLNHFLAISVGGIIQYANPAGARLLGLKVAEDLINKPFNSFVSQDYAGIITLGLEAITEEPCGLPLKLVNIQGNEIDVKMWVSPWRENAGAEDAFLIEIHDLSAHVRAAQTLRNREQKLSDIIASVADGIVTLDEGGAILSFNRAAEQIFGYTAPEVLGMKIADLAPGIDQFLGAPEAEDSFHEIQVRRKDEKEVLVEFSGRSLPDDHDSSSAFTWVMRDVTERRMREEQERIFLLEAEEQRRVMEDQASQMVELADELYTLKQMAESADQMKSRFLASMSHELRTPLNAIIGFSEVMKDQLFGPIDNPRYVDYSTSIHGSGTYLLKLINDILDLSKIEAGAQELFYEEFAVQSVVIDCVDMVRDRALKGDVYLNLRVSKSLPMISADKRRIKQIILNLLTNAIKFSPPASLTEVQVYLDGNGGVSVCVIDQGKGIAQEDIAMVLEPFGQIHDQISRQQEGTGLGLPICKQFMELHGGDLIMESKPGKGTTVTISFPPDRTVSSNGNGAKASHN